MNDQNIDAIKKSLEIEARNLIVQTSETSLQQGLICASMACG